MYKMEIYAGAITRKYFIPDVGRIQFEWGDNIFCIRNY